MTTASVLLTVTTSWAVTNEKADKDGRLGLVAKSLAAEAAKELRETPLAREQGLRLMKEWILKNPDIRNVRTDDEFLLRFLRHKKYSIPMAQQTLLKYLSLRNYYPEIFKGLDPEDAKIQQIISDGYITVSPVRDTKGRRVIMYSICNFNPSKYSNWDLCRAHALVYESLLDDSLDQMCGFVHLGDGAGVTAAHITAWNPTDFARLLKWGEQSMPMRHKEFHLLNVPSAFKYIVDFATSKVTPKMYERLHIHTNMKNLHQFVDLDCLPKKWGGNLQFEDLVQYTKQLLKEKRPVLVELENMEILSTKGIISSRRPLPNKGESMEGSFRKLEID